VLAAAAPREAMSLRMRKRDAPFLGWGIDSKRVVSRIILLGSVRRKKRGKRSAYCVETGAQRTRVA